MGAEDWGSKPPKVHALTPAATISLDPSLGVIFKDQPGQDQTINATSPGKPGERITIQFDTIDANSRTITFGTNFRSTGTLATGATSARRFNVTFVSDGLGWSEVSRTAAMA